MLILIHLSLMTVALLCLVFGVSMAMLGRKKKSWLKIHRGFNTAGTALLWAGAAGVFAHVASSGSSHLAGLHQGIGLAALVGIALILSLGLHMVKAPPKPALRPLHRWLGRLSMITMLAAFFLGLNLIGMI